MSKTKLYGIWKSMIERCNNKNSKAYPDYGGRGIKVCREWSESFEQFYMDVGDRPGRRYSLERKNNNGDYRPENVKWATDGEQALNRRDTRLLTYRGETKAMKDWAECIGIGYYALRSRLNGGWSVEDALSIPVGKAPVPTADSGSKKAFISHVGEKLNNWTIISYDGFVKNVGRRWLCRCACGTERVIAYSDLKRSKSRSCGCLGGNYAHA